MRISALCFSVLSVLASAWACGGDGGSKVDAGGSDGDADSDADSDGDGDTDTETESDSWGESVPCPGEPQEGEVCVPGGKYVMGCVPGDTECEDSEKPLVTVTLSPFYIEIEEADCVDTIEFLNTLHEGFLRSENYVIAETGGDYPEYVWVISTGGASGHTPIRLNEQDEYEWIGYPDDPGEPYCRQNRTVDGVCGGFSPLGARLFCEWKGKQLPSEAQWEAAARGQTLNEYPCGSDLTPCWNSQACDCCMSGGACAWEKCMECCIPFHSDEMAGDCDSPFGVIGMYGNAAEWVADGIEGDHSWCEDGCTDPAPAPGEKKALKGGSIKDEITYTRISARKELWNELLGNNSARSKTGVRCVRPAEEPDAGPDGGG